MRSDGLGHSRFAGQAERMSLPAIDHEANGPISALVRLTAWLGRLWDERADKARAFS